MVDDITHTISNIAIGDAQRKIEQTPAEPIEPPKPAGQYEVDQSVIDGKRNWILCPFSLKLIAY
jgi:hypothetical protein